MREYTRWAAPVWFICKTVLDLVPRTPTGMLHGRDGTRCPRGRRQRDGGADGSVFVDDDGLGRDHLLAAVVAVGGDVVADVGLAGGRVGGQLLGRQAVVRAALATAGGGDAGFLHSHGNCSSRFRLLLLLLQGRQRRKRVGACFFVRG